MSQDERLFEVKLTDERYGELAQLWDDYMWLGPKRGTEHYTPAERALDFCQYIDSDPDEDPRYGLPDILAFFAEKERRQGTGVNEP